MTVFNEIAETDGDGEREVYVAVALADLSPAHGLLVFLAKSHKREMLQSQCVNSHHYGHRR